MRRKYSARDVNPMSYREFGEVIDKLISKIYNYAKQKREKFDIIAPILRSGGVVGCIVAIKLNIPSMLPIQFKYIGNPPRLKRLLSLPRIKQDIAGNSTILVCETMTGSGETAKQAIGFIKRRLPNSKVYYATAVKAYRSTIKLEGVEEYFFGIQSDEDLDASNEEIKCNRLRPKITIFPWEDVEEELKLINALSEWDDYKSST